MIDIHSHILPGIDDGARNLEESVAMIQAEVEGGVDTFIATPHFIERPDYDRVDVLPDLIKHLKAELSARGVRAKILPGGEIYPTPAMLSAVDKGLPLTVAGNGKHMLVDLPLHSEPADLDFLLYELQARGITPILAHPERASFVARNPARIREFVERGIALQVNAGSLFGRYGAEAKRLGEQIIEDRLAHFIATDAHRPSPTSLMLRTVTHLAKTVDDDYLRLLTQDSAESILEGRPLPELPSVVKKQSRPKWLLKLMRQ